MGYSNNDFVSRMQEEFTEEEAAFTSRLIGFLMSQGLRPSTSADILAKAVYIIEYADKVVAEEESSDISAFPFKEHYLKLIENDAK